MFFLQEMFLVIDSKRWWQFLQLILNAGTSCVLLHDWGSIVFLCKTGKNVNNVILITDFSYSCLVLRLSRVESLVVIESARGSNMLNEKNLMKDESENSKWQGYGDNRSSSWRMESRTSGTRLPKYWPKIRSEFIELWMSRYNLTQLLSRDIFLHKLSFKE